RADSLADLAERFQFANRPRQFTRALLQFLEQPHILDGDNRLIGESLEESDLLIRKGLDLLSSNQNSSNRAFLAQQRHGQQSAMSSAFLKHDTFRKLSFGLCRHVVDVDYSPIDHGATTRISAADRCRFLTAA